MGESRTGHGHGRGTRPCRGATGTGRIAQRQAELERPLCQPVRGFLRGALPDYRPPQEDDPPLSLADGTEPLTPLGSGTRKRIDVTVVDEILGLEIGVSLKGLNFRDEGSGNFDKNLTGRLYELGDEMRLVHEHLPHAFMAGVLLLPIEAAVDKSEPRPPLRPRRPEAARANRAARPRPRRTFRALRRGIRRPLRRRYRPRLRSRRRPLLRRRQRAASARTAPRRRNALDAGGRLTDRRACPLRRDGGLGHGRARRVTVCRRGEKAPRDPLRTFGSLQVALPYHFDPPA